MEAYLHGIARILPAMQHSVVSRAQLLGLGWTRKRMEAAVAMGTLTRVAQGWYATPMANSWVIEAVRSGGRLGCLSGCRLHGLWTPDHASPHIVIAKGVTGGKPGWHRHATRLPQDAMFDLEGCLAQVIRYHSAEDALIVLESAANQGRVTPSQAGLLISDAPVAKQRTLKFFDPRAESGSETKVRLWLQRNRFGVRTQVSIPGVGRVDHLVGQSTIIECDSAQHHPYREEDYRRDLAARDLGYMPIRLSFHQVHHQWDETRESLLRHFRTGQHRRAPRPL